MGLALKISLIFSTISVICYNGETAAPVPIKDVVECPNYGEIEFATLKTMEMENFRLYALHIECNPGYELVGRHKLLCNDGKWESAPRPQCVAMCDPPPGVENGKVTLEGEQDTSSEQFKKGTLATYSCKPGYQLSPVESRYRVCEKGIWTGPSASCILYKLVSCKQPKGIVNGYYVHEKNGVVEGFGVGQRLHYSCTPGYVLKGPSVQQCLENGSWSPRIPPQCVPESAVAAEDEEDVFPCPVLPLVPHATVEVVHGEQNDGSALPGTVVAYRCERGFRNTQGVRDPCDRVHLHCSAGIWFGNLPTCEAVKECFAPPNIANGHVLLGQTSGRVPHYPVGSKILYQCMPGYMLQGRDLLSCSTSGCWEPEGHHPVCLPNPDSLDNQFSPTETLLVSVGTASGVMLMLLAVCLGVVCRRRKPWGQQPLAQAVGVSQPHPSVSAGDSTTALINDPDRLALIAFADGVQTSQQSGLPSYEEAIRERSGAHQGCGTGLLACRPHRPHWTALGVSRRGRPAPGTGNTTGDLHVTRQSSCTSHSASMRSGSAGGDPMGSTDTMTPSEVSTNVTLDTVSSHSGSQPASCRAICGSLASFDTNSVLNTEGVPLLEENETDETMNPETTSTVEHHSMADNASFKYRRTSPDIP